MRAPPPTIAASSSGGGRAGPAARFLAFGGGAGPAEGEPPSGPEGGICGPMPPPAAPGSVGPIPPPPIVILAAVMADPYARFSLPLLERLAIGDVAYFQTEEIPPLTRHFGPDFAAVAVEARGFVSGKELTRRAKVAAQCRAPLPAAPDRAVRPRLRGSRSWGRCRRCCRWGRNILWTRRPRGGAGKGRGAGGG